MKHEINQTQERIDKFKSHLKLRQMFEDYMKEHAESNFEEGTNKVFDFDKKAFDEFINEYEEEYKKEVFENY